MKNFFSMNCLFNYHYTPTAGEPEHRVTPDDQGSSESDCEPSLYNGKDATSRLVPRGSEKSLWATNGVQFYLLDEHSEQTYKEMEEKQERLRHLSPTARAKLTSEEKLTKDQVLVRLN